MKFGYARVSTRDQNLQLQIDDLKKEGCEIIFREVICGAKAERPELDRLLEQTRADDVIVVWKLEKHPIVCTKNFSEPFCHFFRNVAFSVLHFTDVMLRGSLSKHMSEPFLSESLS